VTALGTRCEGGLASDEEEGNVVWGLASDEEEGNVVWGLASDEEEGNVVFRRCGESMLKRVRCWVCGLGVWAGPTDVWISWPADC
jgi:hypothetical protein